MINIAVVGYGYWGPNLVRNIQELGDARAISCCDMNPERLAQVKSKFPSIETTTRYEDILNNPLIDAVVISTPVSSHYELARKAFEHGKHVLLEKPATASVAEAEKLVELADQRKLTFMVDHTFIYTGAVSKMKEIIDRGDLGDLYYFDSVRINLGLIQRDVNVLWDLAPHDLAIMDHLVKEKPVSVCATGACHVGNGHENVAYLTVYFDSGLIAHFHNNWLSPVKVRTMLVGGSKKTIHYDDMEVSEKIKIYDRGVDVSTTEGIHDVLVSYRLGDMWAPRLNVTEALRVMVGEFVGCVQTGRRPITDGISGLNVVKILEASEKSIKQRGKEIRL
ncbi:MAG: Gfo/Idh/MocA family oxidoreductase [Desulfobacteraceae bacterium]|nr:Gfo/Idh/MocA family oxidoreductase [Desulfobacteraceae bacterium]